MNSNVLSANIKPKVRCAIYTRITMGGSIEEKFTTSYQRSSCEIFIKLQEHKGWYALPDKYEDCSSGNKINKPALKRLRSDIKAQLVDLVVVSSLDRLSRSYAVLSKLLQMFGKYEVRLILAPPQCEVIYYRDKYVAGVIGKSSEPKYKNEIAIIESITGQTYSDVPAIGESK